MRVKTQSATNFFKFQHPQSLRQRRSDLHINLKTNDENSILLTSHACAESTCVSSMGKLPKVEKVLSPRLESYKNLFKNNKNRWFSTKKAIPTVKSIEGINLFSNPLESTKKKLRNKKKK